MVESDSESTSSTSSSTSSSASSSDSHSSIDASKNKTIAASVQEATSLSASGCADKQSSTEGNVSAKKVGLSKSVSNNESSSSSSESDDDTSSSSSSTKSSSESETDNEKKNLKDHLKSNEKLKNKKLDTSKERKKVEKIESIIDPKNDEKNLIDAVNNDAENDKVDERNELVDKTINTVSKVNDTVEETNGSMKAEEGELVDDDDEAKTTRGKSATPTAKDYQEKTPRITEEKNKNYTPAVPTIDKKNEKVAKRTRSRSPRRRKTRSRSKSNRRRERSRSRRQSRSRSLRKRNKSRSPNRERQRNSRRSSSLERRREERKRRHAERDKHDESRKSRRDDRSPRREKTTQSQPLVTTTNKENDNETVTDPKAKITDRQRRTVDLLTSRTGGAYIPPAKLRLMQAEITDKASAAYQRIAWEALKKSIHGYINKVNVDNIAIITRELLKENIVRGRGLLCRSIIQAQAASPTFTHVYAALVSIINSKFPNIGELLLKRLVIQFKRAFRRNDKAVCLSASRFVAHLVNQRVAHEILALEILTLLVETPTDDSVEVAIAFLKECGMKLSEVSSKGIGAIFEMLKNILHEGKLDKRVQYMIEVVFQVRKDGFKDHQSVIETLELVEEDDQFTHLLMLDEATNTEDILNVFKFDENYALNEDKYKGLSKEILGSDADSASGGSNTDGSSSDSDTDNSDASGDGDENGKNDGATGAGDIIDNTETNLIALRRTIYLTINSSLDYEECAHKLMKLQLKPGQEIELCHMFLDCCAEQRTYEKFYGLLAQRFCTINKIYIEPFEEIFKDTYQTTHRLDTNRLRNVSKFFAHLLFTDAISWDVLDCIKLNEDDTTSSSRIFIKILFQELAEYMGLSKLNTKLKQDVLVESLAGLFPKDNPRNTRFAINFFTSIGLGGLTDDLRQFLKAAPKTVPAINAEILANKPLEIESSSESSSESESSSSSESSESSTTTTTSSSSSSESSDEPQRKRKRKDKGKKTSKKKTKLSKSKLKLKEKSKDKKQKRKSKLKRKKSKKNKKQKDSTSEQSESESIESSSSEEATVNRQKMIVKDDKKSKESKSKRIQEQEFDLEGPDVLQRDRMQNGKDRERRKKRSDSREPVHDRRERDNNSRERTRTERRDNDRYKSRDELNFKRNRNEVDSRRDRDRDRKRDRGDYERVRSRSRSRTERQERRNKDAVKRRTTEKSKNQSHNRTSRNTSKERG